MDEKANLIKEALESLFEDGESDMEVDQVDEVVFSYIAGVLEESLADVDVEEFIAIMDAYIPGFADLQHESVEEFMKSLHGSLETASVVVEEVNAVPAGVMALPVESKSKRRNRRTSSRKSSESETTNVATSLPNYADVTTRSLGRSLSESSSEPHWPGLVTESKRLRQNSAGRSLSVTSTSSLHSAITDIESQCSEPCDELYSTDNDVCDAKPCEQASCPEISEEVEDSATVGSNISELIDQLVDMFPHRRRVDIKKSLGRNRNDLEATVLCLLEEPAGEVITSTQVSSKDSNVTVKPKGRPGTHRKHAKSSRRKSNSLSCDEKDGEAPDLDPKAAAELKSLIVDRYSYISTDSETKTHRPKLLTTEEKKMVRYRNGQVVSTKGEWYSDVKPALTDDMKKTYINLKPAKQYRFH